MKSIIIYDWMLKDPNLSGYKLLMFATIYHFTSLRSCEFMSIQSWLDLLHCSRSQFFKVRDELIQLKYIEFDRYQWGYVTCYIPSEPVCITKSQFNDVVNQSEDVNNLTWEEMIERLMRLDSETAESDNETAEFDNETAESDNETLPY